ncbi:MAG TPA: polysaccharide deacetylase family protein [Labilithrix sp.]|nr:polysaccharide deacetylase family protein [Labilithrix sp.]
MTASIVLSLDFELRWGVQDHLGDDFTKYRKNLEGVREAVPAMLELFARRGVRATWATVGAVACADWDEWAARAPAWPRNRDGALAWNEAFRTKDPKGVLYFAPDLVERIRRAPGQELGSHTFSHVYMGEPGFVRRDALADAAAVVALFRDKWNEAPRSFVFPRNQVAFEDVLAQHGIRIWRANPTPFFWSATTSAQQSIVVRALRVADALAPLGTRTYRREGEVHRASHFVRFTLPELAWRAHVRRLAAEASRLGSDDVLHLWWHPHNLGGDVERSIARLDQVIGTIQEHAPPATRFATMGDLAS